MLTYQTQAFLSLPQRFPISRTLPRVTGTDVLGALSRSVGRCDPKSELWVSGSKVDEVIPWKCMEHGQLSQIGRLS